MIDVSKWSGARVALAVLFAAGIGTANFTMQPLVGTAFAETAASERFDTVFKFKFLPELKNIPSLERIFRDHPEVEAKFRAKARAAYEKGGSKELLAQAAPIGAMVLADAFNSYLPRARREDLISFSIAMAGILGTMNETDPEACVLYQFGVEFGRPLEPSRLTAASGQEHQKKLLEAMNAIVVNAADKPVEFDESNATTAFTALAVRIAPLLTGKSGEVAAGKRLPADATEAKAACGFGATLFKEIAGMDAATAELILRKMFAPTLA